MKKEEFFEILSELDTDILKEANETIAVRNKTNWKAWVATAACLALVLVAVSPQLWKQAPNQGGNSLDGQSSASAQPYHQNSNLASEQQTSDQDILSASDQQVSDPDGLSISDQFSDNNGTQEETGLMPAQTIRLVVNQANETAMMDMDVQVNTYEKLPENEWEEVINDFHNISGISYDDFLSRFPDGWELSNFYSMSSRSYEGGVPSDEYQLHDYIFQLNSQQGGSVTVALCSFEKPLRDCFFVCENPQPSIINDAELTIYGSDNWYEVQFRYNDINYDMEARNITLDELQDFLVNFLD